MDDSGVERPTAARLAAVPLLSSLADDELAELARRFELKHYVPGARIVHEGTDGYEFYLLLDGTVDVRHGDTVVRTLGAGDHFGEIGMLDNTRRTADVIAVSACEVGYLFGTSFRELQTTHPEITEALSAAARRRRD